MVGVIINLYRLIITWYLTLVKYNNPILFLSFELCSNNKNYRGPKRLAALPLVKDKPSTLPGGAPPQKKACFIHLLNEGSKAHFFSHPVKYSLIQTCDVSAGNSQVLIFVIFHFFDCSEGSSAIAPESSTQPKKLFYKLRLRYFGKQRFLKAYFLWYNNKNVRIKINFEEYEGSK